MSQRSGIPEREPIDAPAEMAVRVLEHCTRGHRMTEENTYWRWVRQAECRACRDASRRAYDERHAERL